MPGNWFLYILKLYLWRNKFTHMRYFAVIALILSIISCNKEDDLEKRLNQAKVDDQLIQDYLKDNQLEADTLEVSYNGVNYNLYYHTHKEGTGPSPEPYRTVRAFYKGSLLDGTVFDETDDKPASFNLQNVVPGWTFGIPLMRPGGRTFFYIPSGLGYGNVENVGIPANSVLLFDVILVDFQ